MLVEKSSEKENRMITINPIFFSNDRALSTRIARNKEQIIGATTSVQQWNHSQVNIRRNSRILVE